MGRKSKTDKTAEFVGMLLVYIVLFPIMIFVWICKLIIRQSKSSNNSILKNNRLKKKECVSFTNSDKQMDTLEKAQKNNQLVKEKFQQIKYMVDLYNEYSNNPTLMKYVDAFIKQEFPIIDIELWAYPYGRYSSKKVCLFPGVEDSQSYIERNKNVKTRLEIPFINIVKATSNCANKNSDIFTRLKILQKIKKTLLLQKNNKDITDFADYSFHKYALQQYKNFEKILKFYHSLCLNNMIIDNSVSDEINPELYQFAKFDALLVIIAEKQHLIYSNKYTNMVETLDSISDISVEDFANVLIANELEKEDIITYLSLKLLYERELYIYTFAAQEAMDIFDKQNKIYSEKQYLKDLAASKKNPKTTLTDIDLMSGREFEIFVSELFKKLGYKTKVTPESNDQGIDVLATKRETTIAIQAKCYSGAVGNHAIMEAVAGKAYYSADKCMVVTNSTFTKSAKELALKNNVTLWDRKILKEKILEVEE